MKIKKTHAFCIIFFGIIAIGIVAVFLVKQNEKEIKSCYSEIPWEMCSEQGVFFLNDSYLSFADPSNGKRVLICNTVGCTHEKSDCSAAFDSALVNGVSLMEDKIIYLSNEGIKDKIGYYVYEADTNGMNREKVAYIPEVEYISGVTINNDRIVICYQNNWDKNNRELDVPKAGIYVYDFEEKEGTIIYELQEQNALVSRFEMTKNGVLFTEYYNDLSKEEIAEHATDKDYVDSHSHSNLVYVSYSGEDKKILDEGIELASNLKAESDSVYYVKENKVYCCELVSGKKQEIYSVEANEKISVKPAFDRNGFIIQCYQEESNTYKMFYYDIKEKKSQSYGESDISVIAEYEDYTYVNILSENNDVVLGYIKTKDMMQKKWNLAKPFGTEYLEQMEG